MLATSNPMEPDIDFMVQSSATYFNLQQVDLVLTLLQERVDPKSIPDYVRQKVSGVDLTVEEVLAIQDGRFHFSGSGFYMRMMHSGNFIAIDVVEDFYLVLPEMCSLDEMRTYIEEEYEFVIDDYDLIDLYDGSFTIAGEETIDLTTETRHFIPRSQCSEILWMDEEGCSADFVSKYVWFKYRAQISSPEVIKLAWTHELTLAAKRWSQVLTTRCLSSSFNPPCLKQTPRRKQPPLPIITASLVLPERKNYAEQLQGETYTANPDVLCHNNDGTYTTIDDFLAGVEGRCDFLSQDSSDSLSHTSKMDRYSGDDSDRCWDPIYWRSIRNSKRVGDNETTRNRESDPSSLSAWSMVSDGPPPLGARGNDGHHITNPHQPGPQWNQLPQDPPEDMDDSMDTDSDIVQQMNDNLDFSFDPPNSAKVAGEGSSHFNRQTTLLDHTLDHHYSTPSVFCDQVAVADSTDDGESSALFDQERFAKRKRGDSSPVSVDLEMGILHTVNANVETDLENGDLIAEQRSRKRSKRHSRLSGCGSQV